MTPILLGRATMIFGWLRRMLGAAWSGTRPTAEWIMIGSFLSSRRVTGGTRWLDALVPSGRAVMIFGWLRRTLGVTWSGTGHTAEVALKWLVLLSRRGMGGTP